MNLRVSGLIASAFVLRAVGTITADCAISVKRSASRVSYSAGVRATLIEAFSRSCLFEPVEWHGPASCSLFLA
jgi:hypothetical protein